jgi:hypothetical protein
MNSKTILLALLVVSAAWIMMPPMKIQGQIEKYTSDPGYGDGITVVTPDEIDKVVRATQVALSKQIGKCTYCIETTNIQLQANVYYGRFLFTVLPGEYGMPYGIGVDSVVDKKTYTVTSVNLQSTNTIDQMDPYEQFKAGSEVQASVAPTLAQLQTVNDQYKSTFKKKQ